MLIEYAFESIQILKFLLHNEIELKPSSWPYAIHSQNPEIIQILEIEEKKLEDDQSYKQCFIESIKCHHNDFALYFENNIINEKKNNLN